MGFSLEQQNEKMQEKAVRGHYHKSCCRMLVYRIRQIHTPNRKI